MQSKRTQSFSRRTFGAAVLAATSISALGFAAPALADGKFPEKPVEVIMHGGIGGGTDVFTRMMALATRRGLGADIVVVQKSGGAGAAALKYVATRPADGYTIFTYLPGHIINILQGKSPIAREDIIPLARGNVEPNVLFVRADNPIKTLDDLIAAGKARKLRFGGTAVGAIDHIGVINFADRTAMQAPNYIPYKGGGKVLVSLVTGDIEVAIGNVSEAPQLESGEVRAIVVLSDKRIDAIPDVPTSIESGINAKSEVVRGWAILAKTPEARIAVLEKAMLGGMDKKVYQNYLISSGMSPDGIGGRKEFGAHVDELYTTYAEVLKTLGLLK